MNNSRKFSPVLRLNVWKGLGLLVGISLFCLGKPAEVRAQAAYCRTNYYYVTGSTIREIRHSIMRNRPLRVDRDALTEWSLRARCSPSPFQGAYRCAGFNTIVTVRITLPRWIPPTGASEAVRQAWTNYITALTEHELGHAQFALSAAAEVHRQVREMGTAPDQQGIESRVQSLVMETTEAFKQREREYDRLTNHGVERGVVLAVADEGSSMEKFRKGKTAGMAGVTGVNNHRD